ncbi:MAG: hypothetical protein J7L15_01110 [Clostridiales bacterium]|nr:hypothetical protein [Clostridiales bacterium]
MKFKNYRINEAFDKPYKYKMQSSTETLTQYSFQDEERDVFMVNFVRINHRKNKEGEEVTGVNLSFTKDGSWETSQGGTPFRVFATIYDIIKNHGMKYEDFLDVGMDADETSRLKLYSAMMKKLQKEFNMPFILYKKHINVQFITISKKPLKDQR